MANGAWCYGAIILRDFSLFMLDDFDVIPPFCVFISRRKANR